MKCIKRIYISMPERLWKESQRCSLWQVKELSEEAVQILASVPRRNPFLEELVEQLIYREK